MITSKERTFDTPSLHSSSLDTGPLTRTEAIRPALSTLRVTMWS
ncbi:hypothetical protein [Streptomyces sp. NPDC096323]